MSVYWLLLPPDTSLRLEKPVPQLIRRRADGNTLTKDAHGRYVTADGYIYFGSLKVTSYQGCGIPLNPTVADVPPESESR